MIDFGSYFVRRTITIMFFIIVLFYRFLDGEEDVGRSLVITKMRQIRGKFPFMLFAFFLLFTDQTLFEGEMRVLIARFFFRFFAGLSKNAKGKLLWKAKIICCTILVFSKMNIVT